LEIRIKIQIYFLYTKMETQQIRSEFETALKFKLAQKTATFQKEDVVLLKCFKHFDTDEDGLIDFSEWTKGIEKLGIVIRSQEDLKHLFEYYDVNQNGKLDFKEFSDIVLHQKPVKVPLKEIIAEDKEEESTKAVDIVSKLREKFLKRGARGLLDLAKLMKETGGPKKTMLTLDQFKKCCIESRLGFSEDELAELFGKFEFKKTGKIKYPSFIDHFKGHLNEPRTEAIKKAFEFIDVKKNGLISIVELKAKYNAKNHPDVISGKKSEDDILLEFLETFDTYHESIFEHEGDESQINLAEFQGYYAYVSHLFTTNDDFIRHLQNVWSEDKPIISESKEESKIIQPSKKVHYIGEPKASYKKGTANKSSELNTLFTAGKEEELKKQQIKTENVQKLADEAIKLIQKGFRQKSAKALLALLNFAKTLKEMDLDKTGFITIFNFNSALLQYRIKTEETRMNAFYEIYDKEKKGKLRISEILDVILGGKLDEKRHELVKKLFDSYDKEEKGKIDKNEFIKSYNPTKHPYVQNGKATIENSILDFNSAINLYLGHLHIEKDQKSITESQFIEFFKYLSIIFPEDFEFEQILTYCFKVPGISPVKTLITKKPTTLLNPPFDISLEPTNYVTSKQFAAKKPILKPQEELNERKIFEKLRIAIKIKGIREIFNIQKTLKVFFT